MVSAPGVTSNFGGQWERAGETCASRETWRTRVSSESRATAAQNVYFSRWRESRRRENIEKWNLKINLPGLKSTTFNKWTRVRMWRYWFINTPKIPWKKKTTVGAILVDCDTKVRLLNEFWACLFKTTKYKPSPLFLYEIYYLFLFS